MGSANRKEYHNQRIVLLIMISSLNAYLRKLSAMELIWIEPGWEIVFARSKLIENDVNDLHAVKK